MRTYLCFSLLALVFIFTACEKDAASIEGNTVSSEGSMKVDDMSLRMLYSFYDCADVILGRPCNVYPLFCAWPPLRCLPTVTIYGMAGQNDLDDFLHHVEFGTYDDYFSGEDYKSTFGVVDSFPAFHELLKEGELSFVVQRSDTLDRHLYVIGYDSSVEPSKRTQEDELITFEIND